MSRYRAGVPFTDDWGNFRFEVADRVATITLDRPDKLNALTFDVYADLRDLLTELPHRDDVEAVVITGAGKGFCSGGDVDEIIGRLLEMDARDLLEFTRMTGAVVRAMRECPIPIVAAVNGTAAGAGAVIALAADLRVVADTARFHFLFTKVGLAGGDMGAAYLLPRIVGAGRATEILLFGDPVDAATAERIGLANRVVPVDQVVIVAGEIAARLAAGPDLRLPRHQDAAHQGARPRPGRGDRAGGDDPGAVDDDVRPCRVPRRLHRGPPSRLDRTMTTPHRIVAPEGSPPPSASTTASSPPRARTLSIAGQIAVDAAGAVVGDDFATQFDVALGNVVSVVRAAGGEPVAHHDDDHLHHRHGRLPRIVAARLGAAWRAHMGLHFPAVALLGVASLVEPAALVEITATAVVPG